MLQPNMNFRFLAKPMRAASAKVYIESMAHASEAAGLPRMTPGKRERPLET